MKLSLPIFHILEVPCPRNEVVFVPIWWPRWELD